MSGFQIKYRPKTLDEIVGNSPAVNAVDALLRKKFENIPQAILLVGPAGSGKTTIARIIANELGCKEGCYFEYNASNTRGIDTIREIQEQAKLSPLFGDIKVYLLDECFYENTLIETPNGSIPIKEIQIGDRINNIQGTDTVQKIFKNKVLLNNIARIRFSNNQITYCSKDHLFFTEKGWVKAKELDKLNVLCSLSEDMLNIELQRWHEKHGEESIEYQEKFKKSYLSNMQNSFCGQKEEQQILFKPLCSKESKAVRLSKCMFYMWKRIRKSCTKWKILQRLFKNNLQMVWERIHSNETCKGILFNFLLNEGQTKQTGIQRCSIHKRNDRKEKKNTTQHFMEYTKRENNSRAEQTELDYQQSIQQCNICSKNDRHKKIEWNFRWVEKQSWGEWAGVNCATKDVIRTIGNWMGFRNNSKNSFAFAFGGTDSMVQGQQIPNHIQNRFGTQKIEDRNRSGWNFSRMGRSENTRQKENNQIKSVRVESVEIYKQGDINESFKGIVTDKERDQGFIEFYDLQIEKHPSYKANGAIVHNCGNITSQAQVAALKMLEDCPKNTFFILATTDPEKLSKPLRSRCTTITVTPLVKKQTRILLERILEAEGDTEFPEEVLKAIIDSCDGIPRDAVKLLDQVIDMDDIDEMIEAVQQGVPDETGLKDLCSLLKEKVNNKPWKNISACISGLTGEPESIRRGILGWYSKILLSTGDQRIAELMECFENNYYDTGMPGLVLSCFQASLI